MESNGEKSIREFLEENDIEFEQEKRFKDCRNKKPLPFDFYIPEKNLCIEYQGRQHFAPVEKYGGIEEFKKRKHNDAIKKKWCSKDGNPDLLEISSIKDIDLILKERLDK